MANVKEKSTSKPKFDFAMRRLLEHCTVEELIAELQQFPPDAVISVGGEWSGIAIHVTTDSAMVTLGTDPMDEIYENYEEEI